MYKGYERKLSGHLQLKNQTSALTLLFPRRKYFFTLDNCSGLLKFYRNKDDYSANLAPLGTMDLHRSNVKLMKNHESTLCLELINGQKYELAAESPTELFKWFSKMTVFRQNGYHNTRWAVLTKSRSLDHLIDSLEKGYWYSPSNAYSHYQPRTELEKTNEAIRHKRRTYSDAHQGSETTTASELSLLHGSDSEGGFSSTVSNNKHREGQWQQDHYLSSSSLKEWNHFNDVLCQMERSNGKRHAGTDQKGIRLSIFGSKLAKTLEEFRRKEKKPKGTKQKMKRFREESTEYKIVYLKCLLDSVRIHMNDSANSPEVTLPYGDIATHRDRIKNLTKEAKRNNPSLPDVQSLVAPESHTDTYGFVQQFSNESEAIIYMASALEQHMNEQSNVKNIVRWKAWLHSDIKTGIANTRELRALVREGIPSKYRSAVWTQLLQRMTQDVKKKHSSNYFHSLVCLFNSADANKMTATSRRQINLDLMRTMPNNTHFVTFHSKGIRQLQQVLFAFATHNPKIGYCQGMNFIAAVALLFVSAEDTFWLLIALTECYFPEEYYDSLLTGARASQEVLKDILVQKAPKLMEHLVNSDFDISIVSLNWFISLFSDCIPFSVMLRIWDCFFLEGPKVIYRFATALLVMHQQDVIALDDQISKIRFLKCAVKNLNNADILFKFAFETMKPFPRRRELLASHSKHIQRIKQQAIRLEHLRLQVTNPATDLCNVDQCKHVKACLSIPNTDKILVSFGSNSVSQLGVINCETESFQIVSRQIPTLILAIAMCKTDMLLTSTVAKTLTAFSIDFQIDSCSYLWEISTQDVVMDMACQGTTLYAGLLDGSLSLIQNVSSSAPCYSDFCYIPIADCIPVSRILLTQQNYLWIAVGDRIRIYDANTLDKVEQIQNSNWRGAEKVSCMEASSMGIWIAWSSSNVVELWDPIYFTCIHSIQIEETEEEAAQKMDCFVSSIQTLDDIVWIGTHTGRLVVHKVEEAERPISSLYRPNSCDSCYNQGLIFSCDSHTNQKNALVHRDSGFSEKMPCQLNSDPCLSHTAHEIRNNLSEQNREWTSISTLDAIKKSTRKCFLKTVQQLEFLNREVENKCTNPDLKTVIPSVRLTEYSSNEASGSSSESETLVATQQLKDLTTTATPLEGHYRQMQLQLERSSPSRSRSHSYNKRHGPALLNLPSTESLNRNASGSCLSLASCASLSSHHKSTILFDGKIAAKGPVYLSILRRSGEEPLVISYTACLVRTSQVQFWSLSAERMPIKLRSFKRSVANQTTKK
ncbi:hypothetical protein M514_01803, partial [Trichuris suis]